MDENIIGFLAVLAISGAIVFTVLWLKERLRRRRIEKLNRTIQDTVYAHSRALIRKRYQTLRHDDYGNLIWEPWLKEISYFIEKVLFPAIRTERELRAFGEVQVEGVIQIINALVERMAEEEGGQINFGPNLTPLDFENYCADQLRAIGWNASTTKKSGDQGSDVVAEKEGHRLVLQCKLYNHPVGNKAVQEVAAARVHEQADYAAVVTNTRYTVAAQQLASTNGVLLLHHSDLRDIDNLLEE